LELMYEMWSEELALVDKTLERLTEALEEGKVQDAYSAVYDILVWWSKKRGKYDIKEDVAPEEKVKLLKEVAEGKHPIGEEYILPSVRISELVSKLLGLIEERTS